MKAISKILHQGDPKASRALILLHGRGGTADDILDLVTDLSASDFYVIAPQAMNRIWYPQSFLADEKLNEPNLSASIRDVQALIDQTSLTIPKEHIFIVGFSQGVCLALELTARSASQYGGIVAFTGGLIGETISKAKYHGDFEGTKVLITNGDNDPHIPLTRSEQSKEVMEDLNGKVTLKIYKGRPHTISEDEINFVKDYFFKN